MPSVAMNPYVEELASNYPNVLFLTVDVDELKVTHLCPVQLIFKFSLSASID